MPSTASRFWIAVVSAGTSLTYRELLAMEALANGVGNGEDEPVVPGHIDNE